jgi:alcohol dehydrogenase (cytochrome c)
MPTCCRSAWAPKGSAFAADPGQYQDRGQLVPAWSFSFGGEKQRGQESQPLIYNGKMFVTASYSRIFASDAKTGNKLWKYEHRLPDGIMPCCDVVNRGAALYDNLVIFGTLDAQLVALDQDTGKSCGRRRSTTTPPAIR